MTPPRPLNFTRESLLRVLNYEPESGVFTWKTRRGPRSAGAIAGCNAPQGYIVIGFAGHIHYAQRLAWLAVYGVPPTGLIDHINAIKSDNRIANLREVSASQNVQNRPHLPPNRVGVRGVFMHAGRYRAAIQVEGRRRYLGMFDTAAEAGAAYEAAKRQLHIGGAN
jgi:hypothetical protein